MCNLFIHLNFERNTSHYFKLCLFYVFVFPCGCQLFLKGQNKYMRIVRINAVIQTQQSQCEQLQFIFWFINAVVQVNSITMSLQAIPS